MSGNSKGSNARLPGDDILDNDLDRIGDPVLPSGGDPAGRWGAVLWPAFLMAGVMALLIFAVVDPTELHWFGGAAIGWPSEVVYSVTFLLCWIVTSLSGWLTSLLSRPGEVVNHTDLSGSTAH